VAWVADKADDAQRLRVTAAKKAGLKPPKRFTASFKKQLQEADPFWYGVFAAANAHLGSSEGKKAVRQKKAKAKSMGDAAKAAWKRGNKGKKMPAIFAQKFSSGADWAKRKCMHGKRAQDVAWRKLGLGRRKKDLAQNVATATTGDPFWAGVYYHGTQSV